MTPLELLLAGRYHELLARMREPAVRGLLVREAAAEHLSPLLEIGSAFHDMRERYGALLAAAQRIGSAQLELHARLGLAQALLRLGEYAEAEAEAQAAEALAQALSAPLLQAAAVHL